MSRRPAGMDDLFSILETASAQPQQKPKKDDVPCCRFNVPPPPTRPVWQPGGGSWSNPPAPLSQREQGQAGMEAAADHADNDIPGWRDTAYGFVQAFAEAHADRDFLAEEIAPWAAEQGCPPPPDKRAWGAPIQRAGREGVIEQTGLAAKNKLSGNASTWRPLWRTVPKA